MSILEITVVVVVVVVVVVADKLFVIQSRLKQSLRMNTW